MNLRPYVDAIHHDLALSAEAGGEDARALAERLTAPLESALRLALLEALSAAAAEITRDLAPGSVEVRLRGRDPDFVVTPAPTDPSLGGAVESGFESAPDGALELPPAPPGDDEGGTLRINLRLPEGIKLRVEEAARRERLSINAWLVRAVAAGLEPDDRARRGGRRGPANGQRLIGWVR